MSEKQVDQSRIREESLKEGLRRKSIERVDDDKILDQLMVLHDSDDELIRTCAEMIEKHINKKNGENVKYSAIDSWIDGGWTDTYDGLKVPEVLDYVCDKMLEPEAYTYIYNLKTKLMNEWREEKNKSAQNKSVYAG